MYRNTYVQIDNDILTDNVRKITKHYHEYTYFIGVVKANAYGHGIYIIDSLIAGGVNYLAVSSLDEALDIRKHHQEIPILVLEPVNLTHLKTILDNNITITIDSITYIEELLKQKITSPLKVHLKLDTGMNRLGFKEKSVLNEAISRLKTNPKIDLEGIYTHLATSGYCDKYYDIQIAKFKELTSDIDLSKIKIVHLNRSITLSNHTKLPFETGTRLGIIMYGFNQALLEPTGINKLKRDFKQKIYNISKTIPSNNLSLKTAYALYTEVMSIRKVKKGEFVGYGATYKTKEDILVATLPIGYADGINKNLKYVSINHKKYPIIGDLCMDMTEIKIDETVSLHDKVEIFGEDISIKTAAKNLNTNAYHVLTMVTTRVPRIYKDSKIIKY